MGQAPVGTRRVPEWVIAVALPALGATVLYSAAFPPIEQPIAAWLSFAPIFVSIARGATGTQARALGLAFGLGVAALELSWMRAVFGPTAIALWLVFASFPAIALGTIAALRERFGRTAALVVGPFVWLGIEVFRSELWPLRFGWLGSGYALASSSLWIQGADLLGVYGLGLAVLATGACLGAAATAPDRRAVLRALAIAAAIPVALASYGLARLREPLETPTLRVAAVQTEAQTLESVESLARRVPSDVALIVAPEIAAARASGRAAHLDDPAVAMRLAALATERQAIVVVGGTRDAPGDSPFDGFYNTLAIVEPDGRTSFVTKAEPVPLFADGARAASLEVVRTSLGPLGAAICYDATHPHVIGALAPAAQLLVIASGDLASWSALQHVQHARMVRVRAVEHRRWVVRATSSGLSQILDPHGEARGELGFAEVGVLDGAVALRSERTWRDRLGGAFSWGCVAVAAGALAIAVWPSRAARGSRVLG